MSLFTSAVVRLDSGMTSASKMWAATGPARGRALSIGKEIVSGAKGATWGGFGVKAGVAGVAGGAAGYGLDSRDRWGGAATGAGLGVLGFGAARAGVGAWKSKGLRTGISDLRSAASSRWGKTTASAWSDALGGRG